MENHRQHENGYAVRDLSAEYRGDPDGWHEVRYLAPRVVELSTPGDRTVYVQGAAVGGEDIGLVDAAIRAAAGEEDRHSPVGESARVRAGELALKITNAHIRAFLMDALDGWAALTGVADSVVDQSGEGVLCQAPEGMRALILIVTCPSTGRRYGLRVPEGFSTSKEARTWVMRGRTPEIET